MWIVKKVVDDGIEYLPDIVETDFFELWEQSQYNGKNSKELNLVAGIYKALSERENYYQDNTPTAFGNPEYSLLVGTVNGFIQGAELEMDEDEEHFIVRKGKRKILVVDKIKRNPGYFEAKREAAKALRDVLGG